MKKAEKYKLAKWVMQYALDKGAQEVSVNIFDNLSTSIEIREKKIDKLEQANQAGLSVRLLVDKKYSAHSTNRLNNRTDLKRFIEEAITGTRFLSEDEFRYLPDPAIFYKGGGVDLKTFDIDFVNIDPQRKIAAAMAVEKEVFGTDNRIISVTSGYSDGMSSMVMVTSNGFEGDTANTYYGLNVSVSVKGGDARPQSSWNESAIFNDKLKRTGLGEKALSRALRKIGQTKIESEKLPMIIENRLVGQTLSPLISALSGSSIQQKNSFLADMLGEKVGSEMLTIIDDPSIISGRASRHFDNEGLALKRRAVFEDGILKSYYIDTYYGRKLGIEPTSGSTTNLIFKPGKRTIEEMVASMKRGILVTGFNGGNTNNATGDFSYGIDGFLIENGEATQPVSEMNITGNMKELWKSLEEVGIDVYQNSSWRTPSLMFNGVDFSGI